MRLRSVIGVALAAPALIAAGTLAIFLGAGLLIVIAGPVRAHDHLHRRVMARSSAPTHRRAAPWPPRAPIAATHRNAP
jgi:hypothetical protein